MRRLPRLLLNTATATSLALGVVAVVCWTRSYHTGDTLVIDHNSLGDRLLIYRQRAFLTDAGRFVFLSRVQTHTGQVEFIRSIHRTYPYDAPGWHLTLTVNPFDFIRRQYPARTAFTKGGVAIGPTRSRTSNYGANGTTADPAHAVTRSEIAVRYVSVEFATVVLLAAILPLARVVAFANRRLRKPPPGFCPTCRYDLRASPDRCPECGTLCTPPTPTV